MEKIIKGGTVVGVWDEPKKAEPKEEPKTEPKAKKSDKKDK